MGMMASQITSHIIVYSTIYSGANKRKHISSMSLAFVWGIHWWPVNSLHKWAVKRKMFPFDDVIMVFLRTCCETSLMILIIFDLIRTLYLLNTPENICSIHSYANNFLFSYIKMGIDGQWSIVIPICPIVGGQLQSPGIMGYNGWPWTIPVFRKPGKSGRLPYICGKCVYEILGQPIFYKTVTSH